jgi:glycosyltransferase involved in cell wall biosynthesis
MVIPTYNEELDIGNCLESLQSLDYPENMLEIIVVDGGSKDKTTSIVKKFKNVKLITLGENTGVSMGRNVGIDNVKGEILIFIDADCIADRDLVKEHVKHYPEYDCVSGGYIPQKGKTLMTKYDYFFAKILWKEDSAGPCFNNGSYKREVFNENRFDENIKFGYEDKDLSQRILAKNYRFRYEPNAKVEHISEGQSFASVLKKKFRSSASHTLFLKKHFNVKGTIPIFFIPLFVILIAFLGIYGILISLIILLLIPPNIKTVYKMSSLAGYKFFFPFLFLSIASKLIIYLGVDWGLIKLTFRF